MSANSPSSNFWKTDFRLRAGPRHFLTSLIIMVPSSNMLKLRRLRASSDSARSRHQPVGPKAQGECLRTVCSRCSSPGSIAVVPCFGSGALDV